MKSNDITDYRKSKNDFWFKIVLLFLFMEYCRPQDFIPGVGSLHIGMLSSIMLVFSWFMKGNIRSSRSDQTTMLLMFIALLAILIPFAKNNFFAYNQTRSMLLYLPFFLSIILYIDSFAKVRKFFKLWNYVILYLAIRGILYKGRAATGFLEDENDFSLFMNMMVPFLYYSCLYEKQISKKVFNIVVLILVISSIVASFSRGGFVGLITVFACIWFFSNRKMMHLMLILIVMAALYGLAGDTYWNEMGTVTESGEGTGKERIESWKTGWRMFKANPIWGVGGNNFPAEFDTYQTEYFQRGMWGEMAHSLWLTLLPELGIVGTYIYGRMLFYNLRDIFWLKKIKNLVDADLQYCHYLSLAFIASFAGFFSTGTFLSVLYYPHYFYLTAIIVVLKSLAEQKLELLKEA